LIVIADHCCHCAVCFIFITTIVSPTMASTMYDSNLPVFQQLEQAKQDFWNSHANLSEEQRQELWIQAASFPPSNAFSTSNASMAQQTPRSLPSTSNMTYLPVWIPLWSSLLLSNTH
jgi:hypothetical protein